MAESFYDESESLVLDYLDAASRASPNLSLDIAQKTIWLRGKLPGKVGLLSGGGAGHEPAHAGYVGSGMLDAAVSGSVFASPSVPQILSGIRRIASSAGVVLIVKNYTGDIFHFYLAAEKAHSLFHIPVEVLVVGDDVSVGRAKSGKVGRRGLAGSVLVHKILGAFTEKPGVNISDVVTLGRLIVNSLVTIGASLDHVRIPGREGHAVSTGSQVEVGMGIHNEPGCRMIRPRPSLPELVNIMLDQLLEATDDDRRYVDFSGAEHVVLLINNLGGLSPLEFGGVASVVAGQVGLRGIKPARAISGTAMTSFNGPGFSITLLRATNQMLELLDANTAALGWLQLQTLHDRGIEDDTTSTLASLMTAEEADSGIELNKTLFMQSIRRACGRAIDSEPMITEWDTIVGDGDCGITLARGANAVVSHLDTASIGTDAVKEMMSLVDIIENSMDGTSGAIYSIFFAAFASSLREAAPGLLSSASWISAAVKALNKLELATPARVGDRTLMDALSPFIRSLEAGETISAALAASKMGVEATKGMMASLGRAVYVNTDAYNNAPDPGAQGVYCILQGLTEVLLA